MARALIAGCGCRGRALGERLAASGWQVRGTTRTESGLDAIGAAGIEAVLADPGRLGTVFDQLDGVTVVYWLFGSASGGATDVEALHERLLERLLEELVDTPVRGFVYEAGGGVDGRALEAGARIVREASERWRIPVAIVDAAPRPHDEWLRSMAEAGPRLVTS